MSTTTRTRKSERGRSLEDTAEAVNKGLAYMPLDAARGAISVGEEAVHGIGGLVGGAYKITGGLLKTLVKPVSKLVWNVSSSPYIAGTLCGIAGIMGAYQHNTRGLEAVKSGKNLVNEVLEGDIIGTGKGVFEFGSAVANTPGEIVKEHVFNDVSNFADQTLHDTPYILAGIAGLATVKHLAGKTKTSARMAAQKFAGKTLIATGATAVASDMLRDLYYDKTLIMRGLGSAVDLGAKGLNLALSGSSYLISLGINLTSGVLSTFLKNPDLSLHVKGDEIMSEVANVLHGIPAEISDAGRYLGYAGIAVGLGLVGNAARNGKKR